MEAFPVALLVVPVGGRATIPAGAGAGSAGRAAVATDALQGVDRGQARATGGGEAVAVPPPPLPPLAPPVPVPPVPPVPTLPTSSNRWRWSWCHWSSMSRCHRRAAAGGGRLTAPSAARGGGVEGRAGLAGRRRSQRAGGVARDTRRATARRPPLPPVAFCVKLSAPVVVPLTTLVSDTFAPLPRCRCSWRCRVAAGGGGGETDRTAAGRGTGDASGGEGEVPPLPLLPVPVALPPLPPVPVKPTVTVPRLPRSVDGSGGE